MRLHNFIALAMIILLKLRHLASVFIYCTPLTQNSEIASTLNAFETFFLGLKFVHQKCFVVGSARSVWLIHYFRAHVRICVLERSAAIALNIKLFLAVRTIPRRHFIAIAIRALKGRLQRRHRAVDADR